MNIDTGEVKKYGELTPTQQASGKWIKLPKKYVNKVPLTDADRRRVVAADEKRKRKAAKRRGDSDVL